MPSALTVRFRPAGLWRIGPDNGARTRTDRVFHSDSLFSALTLAMRDLGWVDEWVAATAESANPAVRLSSCFPFSQQGLLIQPPRTVWPPAQTGKVRWKAARFVPLSLVSALLRDEDLKEEQWAVDPVSECLVPVGRHGTAPAPFRVVMRSTAAVDRVSGGSESADAVAALQFAQGAGLWFIAVFADDAAREAWEPRLRSASILLADTGVGGGRSRGWGKSRRPHFERGEWPGGLGVHTPEQGETGWWLVSLFSPAETDQVDWKRGNYSIVIRAGRVESRAASGDLKPASRLVAEGSVLLSGAPLSGAARNVAPAELPHPVYRSGIALAVPIPWHEAQRFSLLEPRLAVAIAEGAEVVSPEAEDLGAVALIVEEESVEQVTAPEPPSAAAHEEATAEAVVPAEQVTAPEPTSEAAAEEATAQAVVPAEQVTAPEPPSAAAHEEATAEAVVPAEQVTVPEPPSEAAPEETATGEVIPAEQVSVPELQTEGSVPEQPEPAKPTEMPEPSEVPAPEPSEAPEQSPGEVPVTPPSEPSVPEPERPSPGEVPVPEPPDIPEPRPSEAPTVQPSEIPAPSPSDVPAPQPSEVPMPSSPERPDPQIAQGSDVPGEPAEPPVEEPPQPEEPPVEEPPANPDDTEPRA